MTPFETLDSFRPPRVLKYIPGTTKLEAVDMHLTNREQIVTLLKHNLMATWGKMRTEADKHRTKRELAVQNWVFHRLLPYRQRSLIARKNIKLFSRFFGASQVIEQIGQVAS